MASLIEFDSVRGIRGMAYARGVGGFTPPPRTGKYCWRKMMLFPKALFFAKTFSKIDKNQFSIEFSSKVSQPILFSSKCEKVYCGDLKFS